MCRRQTIPTFVDCPQAGIVQLRDGATLEPGAATNHERVARPSGPCADGRWTRRRPTPVRARQPQWQLYSTAGDRLSSAGNRGNLLVFVVGTTAGECVDPLGTVPRASDRGTHAMLAGVACRTVTPSVVRVAVPRARTPFWSCQRSCVEQATEQSNPKSQFRSKSPIPDPITMSSTFLSPVETRTLRGAQHAIESRHTCQARTAEAIPRPTGRRPWYAYFSCPRDVFRSVPPGADPSCR